MKIEVLTAPRIQVPESVKEALRGVRLESSGTYDKPEDMIPGIPEEYHSGYKICGQDILDIAESLGDVEAAEWAKTKGKWLSGVEVIFPYAICRPVH